MFGLGRKRVELDEFCLGNIVVIIITCSGVILNANWSIGVRHAGDAAIHLTEI